MSEHEKIKRTLYQKNRKKWICILAAALVIAIIFSLLSYQVHNNLNQDYYIRYTEKGSADFSVSLKENTFYDDAVLDGGRAYIASLIDGINADFTYRLAMDAKNVVFDYKYRIDAQLIVTDGPSKQVLFDPVYELVPQKTATIANGEKLDISEKVYIDFQKYNRLASEFIQVYQLNDAGCALEVTLYVDVVSSCLNFEENESNNYFITLNIPLAQNTLSTEILSSTDESESQVLASSNGIGRYVFKTISSVMAVLSLALATALIIFIFRSRNDDINYTIKKNRLLNSYRSFIQQIGNELDTSGYQILQVKSFTELLGIRDTLQAPVLMYENEDQTRTVFFVPTSTNLLYTFEIKVDNYDKIYGTYAEVGN